MAREGKGKGFETENQEVLSIYTKREKRHRFETETPEVLSTYWGGIGAGI